MPSNTTSSMFFYTYVLRSVLDDRLYIGYTHNLRKRLEEHKKGKSFATKLRLPFKLIYFEGCLDEQDARRRERFLKTTQGRRFLGLRLLEFGRKLKASGSGSWPRNTTSAVACGDKQTAEVLSINKKQVLLTTKLIFGWSWYTGLIYWDAIQTFHQPNFYPQS